MQKFLKYFNSSLKEDFLIKFTSNVNRLLNNFVIELYFILKNINTETNLLFLKIRWIFYKLFLETNIILKNVKFKLEYNQTSYNLYCKINIKKKNYNFFFERLWLFFKLKKKFILKIKYKILKNNIFFKINNIHNMSNFKEFLIFWNLPLYINLKFLDINKINTEKSLQYILWYLL